MRTKRVIRHYCDHCSKGSFQKPAMWKHERSCFKNPERICWMCEEDQREQSPLAELIAIAREIPEGNVPEIHLKPLRLAAQDCPCCMLSAILQSRNGKPGEDSYVFVQFSYKEEADARNAEAASEFQAMVGGWSE